MARNFHLQWLTGASKARINQRSSVAKRRMVARLKDLGAFTGDSQGCEGNDGGQVTEAR